MLLLLLLPMTMQNLADVINKLFRSADKMSGPHVLHVVLKLLHGRQNASYLSSKVAFLFIQQKYFEIIHCLYLASELAVLETTICRCLLLLY